MSEAPRPSSAAIDTQRGIRRAISKALGGPLLVDRVADANFAAMINRLRSEPGSEKSQ